MKIKSIIDGFGKTLPFTQQILSFEDWEEMQVNYINVKLNNPVMKNDSGKLIIQYEGCLLGYTETGMMYVKDKIDEKFTILRPDCQAYPSIGVPSWKINRLGGMQIFDYQISVTVPDSLVVANGGELVNKKLENRNVTYMYKNIKPAWRIDIAIAKYGIYNENNLKIFYFPEDEKGAKNLAKSYKLTKDIYNELFGKLKLSTEFSILEIPEGYGSQADVTCILQTRAAFINGSEIYQLYHEISHLWNVKSNDQYPPRFESEGLATFLQFLLQQKLENDSNAVERGVKWIYERFRKAAAENEKLRSTPMIDFGKESFTDFSYSKGMIFFSILYKLLGEQQFGEVLQSFYQKYYEKGATAKEFVNHIKQYSRRSLEKFFADWIFGVESTKYILNKIPIEEIIKKY
jgi:hypothetical protein